MGNSSPKGKSSASEKSEIQSESQSQKIRVLSPKGGEIRIIENQNNDQISARKSESFTRSQYRVSHSQSASTTPRDQSFKGQTFKVAQTSKGGSSPLRSLPKENISSPRIAEGSPSRASITKSDSTGYANLAGNRYSFTKRSSPTRRMSTNISSKSTDQLAIDCNDSKESDTPTNTNKKRNSITFFKGREGQRSPRSPQSDLNPSDSFVSELDEQPSSSKLETLDQQATYYLTIDSERRQTLHDRPSTSSPPTSSHGTGPILQLLDQANNDGYIIGSQNPSPSKSIQSTPSAISESNSKNQSSPTAESESPVHKSKSKRRLSGVTIFGSSSNLKPPLSPSPSHSQAGSFRSDSSPVRGLMNMISTALAPSPTSPLVKGTDSPIDSFYLPNQPHATDDSRLSIDSGSQEMNSYRDRLSLNGRSSQSSPLRSEPTGPPPPISLLANRPPAHSASAASIMLTARDSPRADLPSPSSSSTPTPAIYPEGTSSTLWLRLSCPGMKVKVRQTPNIKAEHVSMIKHGQEVHVYRELDRGFYKLVDGKVYTRHITHTTHVPKLMYSIHACVCIGLYE